MVKSIAFLHEFADGGVLRMWLIDGWGIVVLGAIVIGARGGVGKGGRGAG